jgi:hypothetical protein
VKAEREIKAERKFIIFSNVIMKDYRSVGIETGYGLDDRMIGVRFLASYPVGTGDSFPVGKAAGREADHFPPSSAEVKECVELYLHSPISLYSMVLS